MYVLVHNKPCIIIIFVIKYYLAKQTLSFSFYVKHYTNCILCYNYHNFSRTFNVVNNDDIFGKR